MLTDNETKFLTELTAIMKKYGYRGFVGTVRGGVDGKWFTFRIEPISQDGACAALKNVLEHYTTLLGYGFGEWDKVYSGKWPDKPGSGEMPT